MPFVNSIRYEKTIRVSNSHIKPKYWLYNKMKFHYEFDNIRKIEQIYYMITLPALTGAKWVPCIQDILMNTNQSRA